MHFFSNHYLDQDFCCVGGAGDCGDALTSNEMLKTLYKQVVMSVRSAFPAATAPHAVCPSVLTALTVLTMLTFADAQAIGLGQVDVQSPLGQPLRATIPVLGIEGARPLGTCFSARLSSADGAFITAPRISLTPGATSASLNLSTSISIAEPALTLMVEMGCGEGMQREFSLLLDPPMNPVSTPVPPLNVTASSASSVRLMRDRNAAASVATSEPAPVVTTVQRAPAATVVTPVAIQPKPAAPRDNPPAARNVLRLSSRDGADVELMNAIGLRLARANTLAERRAPSGEAAIPDLAKSAENRAAQARFASLLRDEVKQDPGKPDQNAAATEQKLQDLQAKMLILENETLRLKQASQRDAAALNAARNAAPADVFGNNWVSILAALLVLAAGAIAWLLIRVKHLKQHNMTWDWEENVAAADTDASDAQAAGGNAKPEPTSDLSIFANEHAAPHETIAAPAVRAKTTPAREPASNTMATMPTMEFISSAPTLPVAARGTDGARSLDTGSAATAAGALGMAAGAATEPAKAKPAHDEPAELNFEEIKVADSAMEEISDVMQEAEFWISLRDSQRAIEVLEPYATIDHPTSPLPWLYLFELYADSNQRASYDVLHERFQRVFNGKIPTWEELEQRPPPVYLRGIEDVPHICDKIVALWWTEQIVPYLESLLLDDRDGSRIGFDLPVYREIMFLISIAYDIQQSKKFIKPSLGSPDWTIAA